MKTKTTILIAFIVCLAGCSQQDTYLEIGVTSDRAFLIPSSTSSCRAIKEATTTAPTEDISNKYFTVRGLKLIWKHPSNRLEVAMIRLRFKSRNLNADVNCQVAGDDLLALQDNWDGSVAPTGGGSRTEFVPDCNIKCGGIATVERTFSASGSIDVIGYMTESDGNQIPVKTTTPFVIENLN
jgi:hypothetical protein